MPLRSERATRSRATEVRHDTNAEMTHKIKSKCRLLSQWSYVNSLLTHFLVRYQQRKMVCWQHLTCNADILPVCLFAKFEFPGLPIWSLSLGICSVSSSNCSTGGQKARCVWLEFDLKCHSTLSSVSTFTLTRMRTLFLIMSFLCIRDRISPHIMLVCVCFVRWWHGSR